MDKKLLGKHYSLLHRYKRILINHQFDDCGIGSGQYMFLLHISENEGLSQKDLSQLICIDKGTTTKAIKKLQEEGYVKTTCCCHDKRQHELYLTEKGKTLIPKLEGIIDNFYNTLFKGLSDNDLEDYLRIGSIMETNLCHAVEKIKKEKCCNDKE